MGIKQAVKNALPDPVWGWLHRTRVRWDVGRFQPRQVRHLYGGHPLEIRLEDPLGEGWYDHDWPEPPELTLLRRSRLRPGARVFDLGAHQGVIALMLAAIVGQEGEVVAVEASPHNARLAETNRLLNRAENLRVLHAAVAATSGTLTFNESLNGQVDDGSGVAGRVVVPARSIDDLAREFGPPDVLFIDVEGFEIEALRGAIETRSRRPDCFVEVHVGHGLETFGGSVEAVLASFPENEYDRQIASESHPEFLPYRDESPLLRDRFFLLATAPRTT